MHYHTINKWLELANRARSVVQEIEQDHLVKAEYEGAVDGLDKALKDVCSAIEIAKEVIRTGVTRK